MSKAAKQSGLFRGIYEFEDPSGTLIAAKVPSVGTVDLYDGTAVIVKPSQCAIFVYKGKIADIFLAGTHIINTENVPLLSRMANWKFGFQNPLRCELIFVSGHLHTARRWGSPQPIMVNLEGLGAVPIRTYGNFSLAVKSPRDVYEKLVGSRTTYSISDLEEFVQGHIIELLPEVFSTVKNFEALTKSYSDLSRKLEIQLNRGLKEFGLIVQKTQMLSALPSKEVIDALDAKAAIKVIGSQKEYLLYKAATSLNSTSNDGSKDPMHMMMGLMLGKGLIGADYHDKEEKTPVAVAAPCASCSTQAKNGSKFCADCGKRLS